MRITPMDIRQQQFTVKMFRGFDTQEVDTFLEDLASDYEALLKENSLLKEQLQALEERARGLEEREKVLQETLVTTQRLVEEMKDQAKRDPRPEAHPAATGRRSPLHPRDVLAPARAGHQGQYRG